MFDGVRGGLLGDPEKVLLDDRIQPWRGARGAFREIESGGVRDVPDGARDRLRQIESFERFRREVPDRAAEFRMGLQDTFRGDIQMVPGALRRIWNELGGGSQLEDQARERLLQSVVEVARQSRPLGKHGAPLPDVAGKARVFPHQQDAPNSDA